jgi:hypothetical protein
MVMNMTVRRLAKPVYKRQQFLVSFVRELGEIKTWTFRRGAALHGGAKGINPQIWTEFYLLTSLLKYNILKIC